MQENPEMINFAIQASRPEDETKTTGNRKWNNGRISRDWDAKFGFWSIALVLLNSKRKRAKCIGSQGSNLSLSLQVLVLVPEQFGKVVGYRTYEPRLLCHQNRFLHILPEVWWRGRLHRLGTAFRLCGFKGLGYGFETQQTPADASRGCASQGLSMISEMAEQLSDFVLCLGHNLR